MNRFKSFGEYLDSIIDRDPAVNSRYEVMICHPCVFSIASHRLNHALYHKGYKVTARFLSQISRFLTGIEIHPGAKIKENLFIDHGMGVVIGETAEIGRNVTIYQGVTLGGTGKDTGKRHPTIGNDVMISAGARVLGPLKIGDRSKIGAGSVVLKDIPSDSTAVGIPARVVRKRNVKIHAIRRANEFADLDQINIPDPLEKELESMKEKIRMLEERLDSFDERKAI
ncbi:MAG: serine O-acetyltransferase [Peptostreptococcaceae bacterium]|nr:serine O-acetyltransferase [Peptostreptococcaceae bacterium]